MAKKITISELAESERRSVLSAPRFKIVHPVKCRECGATGPFTRRVFRITGVPASRQCDDDIQGLLQHHFRTEDQLAWVTFRTQGRGFYADSAACSACSSTAVTYDIEMSDELYLEASRITGVPAEQIKRQMERLCADLDA